MYKLLIVDDEHYITDGLYRTFSSLSEFSLEIYRAYCAKQALDYFTRYRMDIIITDINMPIMNGLEMIAEIKNRWPDCRTIILSGYNDFEYAKTALKYGCDFYILKSDGDVPLIDAVSNCIKRLEKSIQEKQWTLQLESDLSKTHSLLQQNFLAQRHLFQIISKMQAKWELPLFQMNHFFWLDAGLILLFHQNCPFPPCS